MKNLFLQRTIATNVKHKIIHLILYKKWSKQWGTPQLHKEGSDNANENFLFIL